MTPLAPEVHRAIWEHGQLSISNRRLKRELAERYGMNVALGTVHKFRHITPESLRYQAPGIHADKKRGVTDWREWSKTLVQMQNLKHKGSWSQDEAVIELGDGKHEVALAAFGDQHLGSWGCNYRGLVELTDEVQSIPNLYLGMLGDVGQYSTKLRSVLEVSDNLIPPAQQTAFIKSWFSDIASHVAFATWGNHDVERGESQSGESAIKELISRRVTYFNGIGHVDIKVGSQIYRGAVSHCFRGTSMLNPCHSGMRYMRFEGTDREFTLQGHLHKPGMIKYTDGATFRVAVNCGSLQENSGYGKRYFSLKTHPVFPIIVFHPDRHEMTPFWSVKEWLSVRGKN